MKIAHGVVLIVAVLGALANGCQTPSVGIVPGEGITAKLCWDLSDRRSGWVLGISTITNALMGCGDDEAESDEE